VSGGRDLVPSGDQLDLDAERHRVDLHIGNVRATSAGVPEFDVRTTYDDVLDVARVAGAFMDTSKWILGDVLNFVERRKSDPHDDWNVEQVAHEAGRSPGGTENIMSVCRRVAYDVRRPDLPWSVHEAVAKLDRAEQIAMLDRVEREALTRDDVRALLRESEPVTRALEPAEVSPVIERITDGVPTLPRDDESPPTALSVLDYDRIIEAARAVIDSASQPRRDANGRRRCWVYDDLLNELDRALPEETQK
jgi:hypothetical protein